MIQCFDKFTNFGLTMSFVADPIVADPIIGWFLVVKTINNILGNSLLSNERMVNIIAQLFVKKKNLIMIKLLILI
uniref:Uncharacterized protein n=1 Tax=Romanomermis culicivorax TaxID=13658 RepID=A0A915JT04_ROMCU